MNVNCRHPNSYSLDWISSFECLEVKKLFSDVSVMVERIVHDDVYLLVRIFVLNGRHQTLIDPLHEHDTINIFIIVVSPHFREHCP